MLSYLERYFKDKDNTVLPDILTLLPNQALINSIIIQQWQYNIKIKCFICFMGFIVNFHGFGTCYALSSNILATRVVVVNGWLPWGAGIYVWIIRQIQDRAELGQAQLQSSKLGHMSQLKLSPTRPDYLLLCVFILLYLFWGIVFLLWGCLSLQLLHLRSFSFEIILIRWGCLHVWSSSL